jgi:tetratricopeptide (TPR) repeat protein
VVLQHRPEQTLELDDTKRPEASLQGFEYRGAPSEVPAAVPPQSPQDSQSSDERRRRMRAAGLRNLLGQSQESRPVEVPEAAVPAPEVLSSVDESRLPAEDLKFVEEVRLRASQAETQDAYQRLSVARTASTEAIRAAYLEAAKRFHPDRGSAPGLEGIVGQLQTLFSALKDAYDLIASPQARANYDAQLKAGTTAGKAQSKREEAALALKMGEVLLKKRDFAQALAKLKRSVDLDANGDSMAALAWGTMCDPTTSPAGKEEAAALINKALRAPGISARTYYVAGVMWRTKDPDSAADAFRKALELEPGHADASLELRLLEMRQGRKQQGGGVLSGLLFGKRK